MRTSTSRPSSCVRGLRIRAPPSLDQSLLQRPPPRWQTIEDRYDRHLTVAGPRDHVVMALEHLHDALAWPVTPDDPKARWRGACVCGWDAETPRYHRRRAVE